MKFKTIRKIDELGRVVIPNEIRGFLNLKEEDDVEIGIINNCIVVKRMENFNEKRSL